MLRNRGGGDGAGEVLVVEEVLSETFGRTHLQLIERGADVGEAQEWRIRDLKFKIQRVPSRQQSKSSG